MAASRGEPLEGDRGAFDSVTYPEAHALDIKNAAPTYHWSESDLEGMLVRLDGTNQASWIPNPAPGDATQDITGHFNLAGPYQYKIGGAHALSIPGTRNLLAGAGAGAVLAADGTDNVLLGYNAGAMLTTEDENVAIGSGVGGVGTFGESVLIGYGVLGGATGFSNLDVIIGKYAAGFGVYTGYANVFIGYEAGGTATIADNNVFVGAEAGGDLTTGAYNTGAGALAGANLTDGDYNTFVGFDSGHTATVGGYNVFIGNKSGYYETGSNKLFIDNARRASEDDARVKALIYGIFDAATANQYVTVNGHLVVLETVALPNTGLHLLDTNASHDLIIAPGSDLTADRTLTITTGDADRTLTLANSGTAVVGTGTATRLAEWSDANTLAASTLIKTGAGVLTLSAAGAYTLTVPADGTAALLATANVFTAAQTINVNSATALVVEQDGVYDNVLVVNTTDGLVSISPTKLFSAGAETYAVLTVSPQITNNAASGLQSVNALTSVALLNSATDTKALFNVRAAYFSVTVAETAAFSPAVVTPLLSSAIAYKTTGSLVGNRCNLLVSGSGVAVTYSYGLYLSTTSANSAGITTAYGVYCDTTVSTGTVGTYYGIYLNDASYAGITNHYGVYQVVPTAKNVLFGSLSVGINSAAAKVYVDQSSATGAIPALFLDQGDISEPIIYAQSDAADADLVVLRLGVTGAPTLGWDESEDKFTLSKGLDVTGMVRGTTGLITTQSVANYSAPPTDAELDAAFGTPATLGRGFIATLDDNDADTDSYIVWTSDASWYYIKATKAA